MAAPAPADFSAGVRTSHSRIVTVKGIPVRSGGEGAAPGGTAASALPISTETVASALLLNVTPAPISGASAALVGGVELADSRNIARATRAAQATYALGDIKGAMRRLSRRADEMLRGPNARVSTSALQQLSARFTVKALQLSRPSDDGDVGDEDAGIPKPFCDDWRDCVEPWVSSAAQYHTSCRGAQISDVESIADAQAAGRLNTLSPKGLYALHLLDCDGCVDAELAGTCDASCRIHTLVALARGVWCVPGKGKQPKGRGGAGMPLSETDSAFLRAQFLEMRTMGIVTVAPAVATDHVGAAEAPPEAAAGQQAAGVGEWQPACSGNPPVARVHVVWKERFIVPGTVAAAAAAPRDAADVRQLAQAAVVMAEADGAAIVARQRLESSSAGRVAAFDSVVALRYDPAARKGRVVTGLDRTANPVSQQLSVEYTGPEAVMSAVGENAVARVYDGTKAYNQMPLAPSARRLFRIHDEHGLGRTDAEGGPQGGPQVLEYARCPFGGGQTCTMFSAPMALLRRVLRIGHSAGGGERLDRALRAMAALGPQSKALAVCLQKRVAIRAARGGEVFPYAVAGILDDIADCFRHVSDTETAHTDQFAARTFELANFQTNGKTQIGDDGVVDVLGARADLRKGTLLPKGRKLLETLYQMALLRALMRGASEGSRSVKGSAATGVVSAPTAWIESVAGSFEWAGPTFDWYLRLHRQGLHAAVAFLKKQRYAEAHLSSSSAVARMLVDDVRVALDRALDGRWRPTRFFPADGVEAIRITCARAPCAPLPRGEAQSQAALVQGFVEPAITPAGQQVLGLVGDASIDSGAFGQSVWAVHVPVPASPTASGTAPATQEYEVLYRSVARRASDSSGVLELEPWVAALERYGAAYSGKLLIAIGDNLGNVFRFNRGRVQRGTRAHELLTRLYGLLDAHNIDFVAYWLPRAGNQFLDALSKCRTPEEAHARAQAAGLRLVAA